MNGSEAGASEMMWIYVHERCEQAKWFGRAATAGKRTDLADLEFDIVNGARLDRFLRGLQDTLDEDDRLVVDSLDPADHLLRDELRLDDDETLHGARLLTENHKDHLGACTQGQNIVSLRIPFRDDTRGMEGEPYLP